LLARVGGIHAGVGEAFTSVETVDGVEARGGGGAEGEAGRSKVVSISHTQRMGMYTPLNGVTPLLLNKLEPIPNVRLIPNERKTAFHAGIGFTRRAFSIGN
jgi:hypothetical protein